MSDYHDIIKGKYDLESAKEKYDNIEIPESLEFHINKQIKRKNRNKLIFKLSSIAASLVLAFVIGVNASPALADEIGRIPGLISLVELVRFDKGLKSAVENGYSQKVGESKEDKGIKITVNNLIFDNRKMVIDYSIEGSEFLSLNEEAITDKNGEKLKAFVIVYGSYDKNKNMRGTIEITMVEGESFPEQIILTIKSVRSGYDNKSKVIQGNWKFSIIPDKDLIYDEKIINCNKIYSIANYNFQIENIRMYPTVTYVRIKVDPNYKFNGFKAPYLLDDKGIKYSLIGRKTLNDNQIDMEFESGYFNKIKEISFNASGVYFMTKEDKFLNIDLKNKKILDSSGYGLKFLDISYNKKTNEEIISLEVTDDKILAEMEEKTSGSIDLENQGYNENGKIISISTGFNYSVLREKPYILIMIPPKDKMPKQLKIKIMSVYSGNMGDIKIKLLP